MTTQNKHTPLPWKFERHDANSEYYGNIVGYYPTMKGEMRQHRTISCQLKYGMPEECEANAEFITRACNSHYELVELLRDIYEFLSDEGENFEPRHEGDELGSNMRVYASLLESAIERATGKDGGAALNLPPGRSVYDELLDSLEQLACGESDRRDYEMAADLVKRLRKD